MPERWWLWWWEPTFLNQLQVVLTLGLGGVAWWLARRQVDISKRQMDMQEAQHKLFELQMATAPVVEVRVVGMLQRTQGGTGHRQVLLTFGAKNIGSRVAEGFEWEIRYTFRYERVMRFATALWDEDEYNAFSSPTKGPMFYLKKGFHATKLYPDTYTDLARILVDASEVKDEHVVEWRVQGETGPNPPDGYGRVTVRPRAEGLLDVTPVD